MNSEDKNKDDSKKEQNKENLSQERIKKNIEAVAKLEKREIKNRTVAEHIADAVTRGAGSMPFVIFHILWFGIWILANVELIPGIKPFDPFPFSFLTLVVSLEAIFLSLLVLMTQNRMTKEADKRAHLDLQINMLAEQEDSRTMIMLEKICEHLNIEVSDDEDTAEETDVYQLAKELEKKLPSL